MKTLSQYFNDLDSSALTNTETNTGVDAMRKMKIMTQIDIDESEGLYNTVDDRWSRRAKHHLSKSDIANATETSEFAQGEKAIYENQEVEVRIPIGPNGTAGIMIEGHLRMIDRKKLMPIEEGVLGGLQQLSPLNRIMQLAGLENNTVETAIEIEETETLNEDDSAGTMFNQLYQKNSTGQFKNNPEAARVATVGQVLAGLQSMLDDLPNDLPGNINKNQLKMVPGMGASLLDAAKKMIAAQPPGGTK